MIHILLKGHHALSHIDLDDLRRDSSPLDDAVWIDLVRPTTEEEKIVGKHLSAKIPTREQMQEIEESSRLFVEGTGVYMSAWLPTYDSPVPQNSSVMFILSPHHLTTIRHADHHAFRVLTSHRKARESKVFHDHHDVLVELLDTIVGQTASSLRQVEDSLKAMSVEIFEQQNGNGKSKSPELKSVVQRLGKRSTLVSCLRESSVSMQNLAMFVINKAGGRIDKDDAERISLIDRDISSLREYDSQLSSEIGFLLDSTVGLIGYQQNQSMKILSVAALLLAFV